MSRKGRDIDCNTECDREPGFSSAVSNLATVHRPLQAIHKAPTTKPALHVRCPTKTSMRERTRCCETKPMTELDLQMAVATPKMLPLWRVKKQAPDCILRKGKFLKLWKLSTLLNQLKSDGRVKGRRSVQENLIPTSGDRLESSVVAIFSSTRCGSRRRRVHKHRHEPPVDRVENHVNNYPLAERPCCGLSAQCGNRCNPM